MIANGDIQNWVNKLEDGVWTVSASVWEGGFTIQVYIQHTQDKDKTDRKTIIVLISRLHGSSQCVTVYL